MTKPPFYHSLTKALQTGTRGPVALAIAIEVAGHRVKDAIFRDMWKDYIAAHPDDPLCPLVQTMIDKWRTS